jgi:hypothetical protein
MFQKPAESQVEKAYEEQLPEDVIKGTDAFYGITGSDDFGGYSFGNFANFEDFTTHGPDPNDPNEFDPNFPINMDDIPDATNRVKYNSNNDDDTDNTNNASVPLDFYSNSALILSEPGNTEYELQQVRFD